MKSFALHLVVVFIIGAEYQPLPGFCSSPPASSPPSTPSIPASSTLTSPLSASQPKTLAAPTWFAQRFTLSSVDLGPSQQPGSPNGAKTSRTIQRLIGGHLQHSLNNTNQYSKAYFRRKPDVKATVLSEAKTTKLRPIDPPTLPPEDEDYSDYRDAALLDDTNEIDDWDGGILRLSAGAGKENNVKNKKKEDSKKTLADQVRDGKYGLIENELFKNAPKRPGVISYLPNKEVPDDNAKNYGGLKDEDIWLAEDHLLVLKGGSLNTNDASEPWTPIDDYQAPDRQIKIPNNPKVPPPFPVQFEDNGPVQFIGNHKFPFFYPKNANESFSLFPANGYSSPEADNNDEKNFIAGPRSSPNATNDKDRNLYPPAYPPWLFNNESFKNPFLNFAPPPQNPLPIDNGNDYIDEDDPSLYYPPPYTFVYKSNYTNLVPPGPLVPGIVLPPPPNAFARLKEPEQRKPSNTLTFNDVLNKIKEEAPNHLKATTTTTTELTSSNVITTTQPVPPKNKEVFYVRQRPRPNTQPPTLAPLPPPTTKTTSTSPPQIISFVPQPQQPTDIISTGKPIYYEYFDARNVPPTSSNAVLPQQYPSTNTRLAPQRPVSNIVLAPQRPAQTPYPTPPSIAGYLPSSPTPTQPKSPPKSFNPQKLFPAHIFKEISPQGRRPTQKPLRINPVGLTSKPYNYDEYLYITPKPEIYPNGLSSNIIPQPQQRQPFKVQADFDREVDAIRQTLQYYKTQEQHRQNYYARNPKAKSFYEYAFAPTSSPSDNLIPNKAFTPPTNFDPEPFKPMVPYSRPVDDANGFKAMPYPRTGANQRTNLPQNVFYPTTQQPESLKIELRVGDNLNTRPTSLAPSPRQQPIEYTSRDQRTFLGKPTQQNTFTPQVTSAAPQRPWVSIEKQVVQEIIPQNNANNYRTTAQNEINRSISGFSRNGRRGQQLAPRFEGYYYTQPTRRPNHRFNQFLEQPFVQQVGAIRTQLSRYQLQPQQQQPASLENDTYINTLPSRNINPDAEYISLPPRREFFQQQRLAPQSAAQQNPGNNIYRKPVDLERDILVNYNLPLPPINPDSEYIQPQYVNRNPQQQQQPQQQNFYQRPQYNNNNGGLGSPVQSNSRPPNIYYVNPQSDYRYKGA